jgi:hypothetical protein
MKRRTFDILMAAAGLLLAVTLIAAGASSPGSPTRSTEAATTTTARKNPAMNPKNWIGDKGYIGNNMITPYRKPAGGELLDWQKEYNSQVNKIRWMIEQVISYFKNWTIMHTDYRRPLGTFATTKLSQR